MTVIAAASVTREERLWAEEVARVLEAAPTFGPAVREMVREVLVSLISDVTIDGVSRRDVWTMLEMVSGARFVQEAA